MRLFCYLIALLLTISWSVGLFSWRFGSLMQAFLVIVIMVVLLVKFIQVKGPGKRKVTIYYGMDNPVAILF